MLMSRSGSLLPNDLALFADLEVVVYSIECNSADASQSALVMDWVHETLCYVQHYVHAAGLSTFALLGDMSNSDFNDICGPKVRFRIMSSWPSYIWDCMRWLAEHHVKTGDMEFNWAGGGESSACTRCHAMRINHTLFFDIVDMESTRIRALCIRKHIP